MTMSVRILALSLVFAMSSAAARHDIGIPSQLAGYRSWKKLTPEPRLVPFQLVMWCAPTTMESQLDEARKTHGPHANRWVTSYANAIAAAAIEANDASEFPIGSVIVKEKRIGPGDEKPEGVGVMTKRGAKFAASGGWEFQFYPAAKDAASLDHCVAWHRSGASRDYVFGDDKD